MERILTLNNLQIGIKQNICPCLILEYVSAGCLPFNLILTVKSGNHRYLEKITTTNEP